MQGATGLGKTDGGDGLVEARLSRSSTTVLSLGRYAGSRVEVNGKIETIPASGLQVTTGAGGSDTINSSGANSGAKTANATLYYVYISSKDASSNASSIRLSTVAYTTLNGYRYLGTSGNAAEWRFLGWVRTDASGNLQDSDTQRFVVNYYNRLRKHLFSCPGYSNNDADTTYTTSSTSLVKVNVGTGATVEFISNGEDVVVCTAQAGKIYNANPAEIYIGLSDNDAATGVKWACYTGARNDGWLSAFVSCKVVPAEGYTTRTLFYRTNVGTLNVSSDGARLGATADPYTTYFEVDIMA